MKSISSELMQEMREIGGRVREKLASGNSDDAQRELESAWRLIPEPKSDYEYSLSFVRAALRLMAFSDKPSLALTWKEKLSKLPMSKIDAEPDFLLGVAFYETGEMNKAYSHFKKASDLSKKRCFEGEDNKYLSFFEQRG